MSSTRARDGIRIAFELEGAGTPIVLVHGFASDRAQNWKAPGWYTTLSAAGYRVIALDCRGHGESDKPHDSQSYAQERMAEDVIAVIEAAGLKRVHLMGYSMGGMIAIHLLMRHAPLVDRAVIGGVGESYLGESDNPESQIGSAQLRARISAALVEPDIATIKDPVLLGFRNFAGQAGKDRAALSACMAGERHYFTRAELQTVTQPVLVVCGEKDDLSGRPEGLASAFRHGRAVSVPQRDHMTAVGDKVYKQAVLSFLEDHVR